MWYGQEESKLYAVISGNMIDEEQSFIKHPMMNSAVLENNGWDKLEELAAEGNCVYKADTLEELAEMIGAENLTATVEAYNKDVAAGEDTAFAGSAESMWPLKKAPTMRWSPCPMYGPAPPAAFAPTRTATCSARTAP